MSNFVKKKVDGYKNKTLDKISDDMILNLTDIKNSINENLKLHTTKVDLTLRNMEKLFDSSILNLAYLKKSTISDLEMGEDECTGIQISSEELQHIEGLFKVKMQNMKTKNVVPAKARMYTTLFGAGSISCYQHPNINNRIKLAFESIDKNENLFIWVICCQRHQYMLENDPRVFILAKVEELIFREENQNVLIKRIHNLVISNNAHFLFNI